MLVPKSYQGSNLLNVLMNFVIICFIESILVWHAFYTSYRHVFWGPYEWLTLSKFFLGFSFEYLQVFYICCKPFIYLNISITNIMVDFVIFSFVLPLGSNHCDWLIPNDIWFKMFFLCFLNLYNAPHYRIYKLKGRSKDIRYILYSQPIFYSKNLFYNYKINPRCLSSSFSNYITMCALEKF